MTPKQIIQAYTAMEELVGIALPYHTTRQLAALRKCLARNFISFQKRKLICEKSMVVK